MKTIELGQIVATDHGGWPHAFKVIKMTAKTALCRELELRVTSDDGFGQNGTCVPIPDKFKEGGWYGELTCRIKESDWASGQYLINRKEQIILFPYEDGTRLRYYTD